MTEPIETLEIQRAKLLQEFLNLGDLRPGSITAVVRRCGKPICHCAKPGDPGHDPQFRLTRRVSGKTVSGTFPTPDALLKAQREAAREVNSFLNRVFSEQHKTGRLDLEATEMALRSAMHRAGAAALGEMLQFEPPAIERRTLPCPCGQQARYREPRAKSVLTVMGQVAVSRPYYLCPHCHEGQFPVDTELDILNTEFSPGVRRMQALVGQQAPFDHGRQQMKVLAGLEVATKAVERGAEAIGEDLARREQQQIQRAVQLDLPITVGEPVPILYLQMDGTGVPVVMEETAGRKGKREGQPAHTREAKLGCVFTQTGWDKEGHAIRDPESTTYTGAVQIAGLYHARQHLWELARRLHPNDEVKQKAWMKVHQRGLLDEGKIEQLARSLRSIVSANPEVAAKLRTEAEYFERNAERMRYPNFRRQHLFAGSGVIEAGCKTVIGSRLKQSGMFRTVRGANAIVALRCCHLNGRFEDYWDARLAA